ncbi:MAG TPA: VOC family protein [Gemmatimonadales bacterium]
MATTTESVLQAKGIAPSLTVDDLDRSIRFYEGLGFALEDRWEDGGKLLGVMLRAGDAHLGLSQDDWKKGKNRVKGLGLRLWISTNQDTDELAKRAKAAGIILTREPYDEWGSHAFDVIDPDGFLVTISKDSPK